MRYDADGERWDVYVSKEGPHGGLRSIIFHCSSNSSFGWRVTEVPEGELRSDEELERLEQAELDRLFARSQPFDYAHDPHAREDHVGDARPR
jgi:hypothetical protein